jgi:transposase
MQLLAKTKKIYIASTPVDFRMSMDSLARLIEQNKSTKVHDGSIYVFHNKTQDRIKCLFWDNNGFVLYYKRLQGTKFKFTKMSGELSKLTPEELEVILSGYDPKHITKQQAVIEHMDDK